MIIRGKPGSYKGGSKKRGPRVNHEIRAVEIRLVGDGGTAYGVVNLVEARRIADQEGLDLVEISPTAKPPVVKLIDYGKYKYQEQKRISDARKKQVTINLKEIKFRPNIEVHDLETKLKRAKTFLEAGDKVKLLMQFRGREMSHFTQGFEKFKGIVKQVCEFGGNVESPPKPMGNRIIALVVSTFKKKRKGEDSPNESEKTG